MWDVCGCRLLKNGERFRMQEFCLYLSFCYSVGGSPYATIAILDVMNAIKCDVSTVAFGMCASTATLLLVRALGLSNDKHTQISFCMTSKQGNA